MAKEASVAPKERVNIVYRPATGDAKEEIELPLKFLVMGDFTGAKDDRPVEDRKPVNIDKDNFDDVLSASNVKMEAVMPNKLSADADAQMTVNLDFKGMKDFDPDAIIKKVPELKQLIELREGIIVRSKEFFPYTFLDENKPFKHMQEIAFTYEDIIWTYTPDGIEAEDNWKAPKA